jgi:uncharacterized protein (TIGR02588 family)
MARSENVDQRSASARRTPWLEWFASGVGLMTAVLVFGSIAWQVWKEPSTPPSIATEIERIVAVDGIYRVEFRALNRGGAAAAQVEIEGRITGGGGEETSRAIFDYIPGHSSRRGGLFFTRDPGSAQLSLRPSGYSSP